MSMRSRRRASTSVSVCSLLCLCAVSGENACSIRICPSRGNHRRSIVLEILFAGTYAQRSRTGNCMSIVLSNTKRDIDSLSGFPRAVEDVFEPEVIEAGSILKGHFDE